MRPMIGAIAVGAIAIGGAVVLATSRHSSNAQAYQSTAPLETAVPAPVVAPTTMAAAPALATQTAAVPVRANVVSGNRGSYSTAPTRPRTVVHKRSTKKSVAIIGGSTVGGAIVGGLLGGKKGAVIGGVVAGTAGTVYDRKTRKKVRVE
jgi:uncharacterized protein YcfJ